MKISQASWNFIETKIVFKTTCAFDVELPQLFGIWILKATIDRIKSYLKVKFQPCYSLQTDRVEIGMIYLMLWILWFLFICNLLFQRITVRLDKIQLLNCFEIEVELRVTHHEKHKEIHDWIVDSTKVP